MSLFGKILKTGLDVVLTPVEVIKDVATLGGLTTDKKEPYTWKKLKEVGKDVEDVREELDDL